MMDVFDEPDAMALGEDGIGAMGGLPLGELCWRHTLLVAILAVSGFSARRGNASEYRHFGSLNVGQAEAERAAMAPVVGEVAEVEIPGGEKVELVWIPAGNFQMGGRSTARGRESDEAPVTTVQLSEGYWLGKTEVTQEQWEALMGNNPSYYLSSGRTAPVERVSWYDAMAFCRKLDRVPPCAGPFALKGQWQQRWSINQWMRTEGPGGNAPDGTLSAPLHEAPN